MTSTVTSLRLLQVFDRYKTSITAKGYSRPLLDFDRYKTSTVTRLRPLQVFDCYKSSTDTRLRPLHKATRDHFAITVFCTKYRSVYMDHLSGICSKYLFLFYSKRCMRGHRRERGDLTNVGRVARVWVETKWNS